MFLQSALKHAQSCSISESFSRITSVLIGFAIWPFIPADRLFTVFLKSVCSHCNNRYIAHFGSFNVRISLVAVYPSIFGNLNIHEDQFIIILRPDSKKLDRLLPILCHIHDQTGFGQSSYAISRFSSLSSTSMILRPFKKPGSFPSLHQPLLPVRPDQPPSLLPQASGPAAQKKSYLLPECSLPQYFPHLRNDRLGNRKSQSCSLGSICHTVIFA